MLRVGFRPPVGLRRIASSALATMEMPKIMYGTAWYVGIPIRVTLRNHGEERERFRDQKDCYDMAVGYTGVTELDVESQVEAACRELITIGRRSGRRTSCSRP